MANQLKNMLIGLFVIIACFLVIGIILFIKPSVGDGKQLIKARFSNINGINIGTPVTFAGKTIGEVHSIQLIADSREQTSNQYGQVYLYFLVLKIDSNYVIYTTDDITVQTQGLLGEKYVAIYPKIIKPGQVVHKISPNDILFADSNDLLESAMNELAALSEKIEEALNRVIVWMDKYGDTLGSAIHSLDITVAEIGKAVKSFNDLGVINDVQDAVRNVAGTFGQVDQILYYLDQNYFFDNISSTMRNVNQVMATIASGKGTLGRIIEEDGLYLEVMAIICKANTLMNDINQYGLLFQYNKSWQRSRVRLMEEANRISDPKSFQAYMDKSMDDMTTTLERMQCLTEKFNTNDLAQNKRFKQDFTTFMEQLNSLSERVKLYNQTLFEIQCNQGNP